LDARKCLSEQNVAHCDAMYSGFVIDESVKIVRTLMQSFGVIDAEQT